MDINYLGPQKTYSNQVAELFAANMREVKLKPKASLESVAKEVSLTKEGLGVMAYYNYLEGLVQECLDLIYENDLRIIGAQRLPIILSIGQDKNNIDLTSVYSHPKALAQCSEWLMKNYPQTKQIGALSTAGAASKVSKESGMAIASLSALVDNGLDILAQDIGNKKYGRTNFTDFYLVSKEDIQKQDKTKNYLTMVAITPHIDKPGLLSDILMQVAYHNLNNVKIHSRPALDDVQIDNNEPQMFYLEMKTHESSDDFKRCIDSLKYKLTPHGKDIEVVRVLGSYEQPVI